MLPQFPCQDGYFVTHIPGPVALADPAKVRDSSSLQAGSELVGPSCARADGATVPAGPGCTIGWRGVRS